MLHEVVTVKLLPQFTKKLQRDSYLTLILYLLKLTQLLMRLQDEKLKVYQQLSFTERTNLKTQYILMDVEVLMV